MGSQSVLKDKIVLVVDDERDVLEVRGARAGHVSGPQGPGLRHGA